MTSGTRPVVVRPIEVVRGLARDLLVAAGCSAEKAAAAADVFAEAELRGIGLQGLDYLPFMTNALRSGRIDSEAEPDVVRESEGVLLIDGGGGVGQHAAVVTVDLAAAKAARSGSCVAGLMDASELYMLGYYVERAARKDMVAIACTTSYPLVHPWGGMEPIFGTNPIAIAVPTGEDHPVLIDMATSALANGRIRQAAYHDETVPDGVGLDARGHPTTIAKEIQKGAISPLGGHKGFGLSLAVALLCGPLVGANVGKALAEFKAGGKSGARLGHFFIVIDPEHTVGRASFTAAVSAFLDEVRGSKVAPGFSEIRIPGDRAFAERARALEEGVEILEATWAILAELAAELQVTMPE